MSIKRASLEELKDFANKVRAAGGGNPIDALIPAVPEDPTQCLIAKNLNFNCSVNRSNTENGEAWGMYVEDEALRDKIASKLNLDNMNKTEFGENSEGTMVAFHGVKLPPAIGQVSADFDSFTDAIIFDDDGEPADLDEDNPVAVKTLLEFWPYIEESEREAYEKADFVNDKGEIIL